MKRLISLAALLCGTAHAEFISGNTLLIRMQSLQVIDKAWVSGFVTGAHDATEGVKHCSPDSTTPQQVIDLVRIVLENVPDVRSLPASAVVAATLKAKWPCEKKGLML